MDSTQAFAPVTEAELHAYADGQLPAERAREVEAWLVGRPAESQRVAAYRAQRHELRALFDPVLDETLPQRVRLAAARPRPHGAWRIAAMVLLTLAGGAAGWGLRGLWSAPGTAVLAQDGPSEAFARRAAVAYAVYSPDLRRPVEVDAAHEDQLVTWLSKRLGAPMKPPHLQALGYALEGGRLLPGGQGPVAQFMYRDAAGRKLTLYVSRELSAPGGTAATPPAPNRETAFRFTQLGAVNTFYWVDGPFGYAISSDIGREALAQVSGEVYRQLTAAR